MKCPYVLFFILFISSIAGCASIVSGTGQILTFNSEPDGATVTVAGKVVGKTPLSVTVKKDQNLSLTFEKEGYKTYTTQLSTSLDVWFAGNIVFGFPGLVASTTDGVSGAMHKFAPDQYFVTLTPDNGFGTSSSSARKIKSIVVVFGGDLRLELAQGGGERINAILAVLGTEESEKEATILVLKKLSIENENNIDFARSIVEFYDLQ